MLNRIPTIIVLIVSACIMLTACDPITGPTANNAGAMEQISATHTVTAGWAPYAPYAYLDPKTHQPAGYYIDLFNRVASEAGLKVKWVETTWGTMIADSKSGRFQVMVAPVFRTIPRALEVSFTRPINNFGLSALARIGDDRFHALSDFNRSDIAIAVTQGEVGYEYATHHLPQTKLNVFETGDIALAMTDVVQGRADAAIADSWTIRQYAAEHSGVVRDLFADHPFNQVGAGWFVARGDGPLLVFLDTSIDWLISSGEAKEIAAKYQLSSDPLDR